MKKISLDALIDRAGLHKSSYADQCAYVQRQCEHGKIRPVKSSKLNGKTPSLHTMYFIIPEQMDTSKYEHEMEYSLSPMIRLEYYRKHMTQYINDRENILKLSDFLLHRRQLLDSKVSCNERSFQIWQNEKFLDKKGGKTLLNHCGIDTKDLNYYDTAEPLSLCTLTRDTPQSVLIIENLDTFYSLRRLLSQGCRMIFNETIGTLIYGGGKRVPKEFGQFSVSAEPYLQMIENKFLYFGDLDYEGIGIFETISSDAKMPIVPFVPAYEKMLAMAEDIQLPERLQKDASKGYFYSFFSQETVHKMQTILKDGKYIPQEIITIQDWR